MSQTLAKLIERAERELDKIDHAYCDFVREQHTHNVRVILADISTQSKNTPTPTSTPLQKDS